ncbi:MAG: hypothetical protein LBD94_00015 [Rickettsiales bacterium]|jgi:outer membrane protein OmpA-like peptidoglycan-associated protein|nr:hypothetical protein [Rickettsiales bacterium]
MSKFPLALSILLLADSAFAIGELPVVNVARSVSALDLYGVPPPKQPAGEDDNKRIQSKIAVVADGELLVPNKPANDLWSNNLDGEAPLRMPEKHEYATFRPDFILPEEELDEGPAFAATRPTGAIKSRTIPIIRNSAGRVKKSAASAPKETDEDNMSPRKNSKPALRTVPSTIKSAPKFIPAPMKKSVSPEPETNEDEFAYKGDVPLTKLSPAQLKRAFKKTFTTENKHLSTYQIDDGFDEASFSESSVGFDSSRDLSEQSGGVRPLEVKISFNDDDSALSRDNYNLLTEYAAIVAANPKRAVQISISERGARSYDGRKLAARRLAIIEQVLKDAGIIDKRIIPVLSQRSDDSFVLRVISNDTFQTLSEKKRDMFGDTVGSKTYKSMSW